MEKLECEPGVDLVSQARVLPELPRSRWYIAVQPTVLQQLSLQVPVGGGKGLSGAEAEREGWGEHKED